MTLQPNPTDIESGASIVTCHRANLFSSASANCPPQPRDVSTYSRWFAVDFQVETCSRRWP